MNDRLKKISNILITIKHKSKLCKINDSNKKSLEKLIQYNCVSYVSNNIVHINYKYNKPTIPNIKRNIK